MSEPTYSVAVDWAVDGTFVDTTPDVLARDPLEVSFGRDQARSLSPSRAGTAGFTVNNVSRKYSPENTSSPLYENLGPGRPVRIECTYDGTTYTLYRGYLDDFEVLPNLEDRSVRFTALDALARLQGVRVSTRLYRGIKTGEAVNLVLDAVEWPDDLRDVDLGATDIPFWWLEDADAFDAMDQIVQSEGPGAFISVGPDGEFVFRDRHHRLLRSASTTSQVTLSDSGAEPKFSSPMEYDVGWRDIVNDVTFSIDERKVSTASEIVWEAENPVTIADGASVQIAVQANDPFLDAELDYDVDYGDVAVSIDRDSGQSLTITLFATDAAQVSGLSVRARPVPVARTLKVSAQDTTSIEKHGLRSYEGEVPWAGVNDASNIADIILSHRAERLPIVSLQLVSNQGTRLEQQLSRDQSDRVTVVDSETGLDADFYIEQISHSVEEAGLRHVTTFGLEKAPSQPAGVFVLDVSELDVGRLGRLGLDSPDLIWIWDHPTQGLFDTGLFAH